MGTSESVKYSMTRVSVGVFSDRIAVKRYRAVVIECERGLKNEG
jgi:hypothetical protein